MGPCYIVRSACATSKPRRLKAVEQMGLKPALRSDVAVRDPHVEVTRTQEVADGHGPHDLRKMLELRDTVKH